VLTFLDSACHDSCPIIASVIGAAIPRLTSSERRQITSLALTVNPRSNTPPNVRRFLRARGAAGALDFLLGTPRTLKPLWRKFGVVSAYESGDADIHSADVRVFDREASGSPPSGPAST
jgi:cytochrome oxidase Cu insertion factor (SCO1/SenC/PrrC family)